LNGLACEAVTGVEGADELPELLLLLAEAAAASTSLGSSSVSPRKFLRSRRCAR